MLIESSLNSFLFDNGLTMRRIALTLAASIVATLALVAQTQPAPQGGTPQAPPAQGQAPGDPAAGRGRGGRGAPMWEPDFSKKLAVPVPAPAEEAKGSGCRRASRWNRCRPTDIQEPAQIAFDGNGRMFVLEIRGYMQDADATGELDPAAAFPSTKTRTTTASTRRTVFVDGSSFRAS